MPNPSDMRQILLAGFMILFFVSSMSLVWTFSVIVPYLRGSSYRRAECKLIGIQGVPEACWGHEFFKDITFDSSSKVTQYFVNQLSSTVLSRWRHTIK